MTDQIRSLQVMPVLRVKRIQQMESCTVSMARLLARTAPTSKSTLCQVPIFSNIWEHIY